MIATVGDKFGLLAPSMNERFKRRWAACEALALGRGGVSTVAKLTGMSRTTIHRAIHEIQLDLPELVAELSAGRIRRPGAGRPSRTAEDKSLISDLESLVAPDTRGDPMSPLLWTSKSVRKLAEELRSAGHAVSHMTVARLLAQIGYNLQGNRKNLEGKSHPDRDAQFRHINEQVRYFQDRGQPAISVDTKKRELVGDFKNSGREWRPKGHPELVQIHDFRTPEEGVAIPYGVYDLTRNEGWVSVGIDHNTAAFAIASINHWWRRMGHRAYPDAQRLLITADAGSSNGIHNRLWKLSLQQLADSLGIEISVCHFPPGTSKWNKIEHQMFCHITENWRARPLVSHAVVVNLIGHTTTKQGLKIDASLDVHDYPVGIKVSKSDFAQIQITPDAFHGDWNYTITPREKS